MLILDFSVVAEFLPILTGFFAFREFLLFFFLTFWPFFFLNSKSDFGDSGFRVVIISSLNPSEIIVVVLPSPFSSSVVWILFTVVTSISVLSLVSMLLLLLLVVSKVTPFLLVLTPLILSVISSSSSGSSLGSSLDSSLGFGLGSSSGSSSGSSLSLRLIFLLPIDFLSCFCGENVVGWPLEGIVTLFPES